LGLLVRSWNLFHGNSVPPERRTFLEEAVRLAVADRPDIVCLQEVPGWGLARLREWTGMKVWGCIAARPAIGSVTTTIEVGHALTSINYGFFRSAFSGQGNAILLGRHVHAGERHTLRLNARGFRRAQARWLELPLVARLAWARERRICQAVRMTLFDGRAAVVANLHASHFPPDERLADAEVLRAAVFADALAEPADICVLAGDFNVTASRSRSLSDLTGADWGFLGVGPGVDHILVRGAQAGPLESWPLERRRVEGRVLSDHAPIEVRIR